MPKIREVKTRIITKKGEKEYSKAVITVPKILLKLLDWDYGDEIDFGLDTRNFNDRHMDIRKVDNR